MEANVIDDYAVDTYHFCGMQYWASDGFAVV